MNEEGSVGERLQAVFQQQMSNNVASGAATLHSQVYQTIREALLLGILGPGETLSIRVLAASFGISPMPVREALGRLVIDGALESLPNRAFRVPVTTINQFRELLLMRLRLETLAGEHAAIRAQPIQVRHLGNCYRELAASEQNLETLSNYLAAHRRFHFEIYKIAEMPRLYNAIETLWLRVGPLFNGVSRVFDFRDEHEYHATVFRSMELCDPKAVATAIENDLASAGRRTMQLLEENEDAVSKERTTA